MPTCLEAYGRYADDVLAYIRAHLPAPDDVGAEVLDRLDDAPPEVPSPCPRAVAVAA